MHTILQYVAKTEMVLATFQMAPRFFLLILKFELYNNQNKRIRSPG